MSEPGRPLPAGLGIAPRIVVVFALVFGCMGSVGLLLMKNSLLPTFDGLERNFALDSAKRVVSGFDEQMSTVSALNHDWAYWDGLYAHMLRPDKDFERSNIGEEAMQTSNLHAILLLDPAGRVYGFGARPFDNAEVAQATDVAAPLLRRWERQPRLLVRTECGLERLRGTLCVVCWSAILRSNGMGPPRGTVVMVRELDARILETVAQHAGTAFTIENLKAPLGAPEIDMAAWKTSDFQNLSHGNLQAQFGVDTITLRYQLQDLEAKPLSWLYIRMDRRLMEQGQRVIKDVLVQLAVVALATGLVLLVTVHWWLVRPIARLRSDVAELSATRRWDETLAYDRPDEIGALTQGINGLLSVLRQQVEVLETLSSTDGLTGIANRRQFDERLAHELVRLGRRAAPLSLLLLDVDHFKLYNDRYGHPEGDAVLRKLGALLRASCRQQDLPARVGGEEFALLLPGTDAAGALAMAEKAMKALAALALVHDSSPTAPVVTVSIGIATWSAVQEGGATELFAQVDKALYAAKHQGRMRACVYGTPEVPRL